MADTITLTAEQLKQLFEPMFELFSKEDKVILQLCKELEKRGTLIYKMEDESRVVPPPPADWNEEEWEIDNDV